MTQTGDGQAILDELRGRLNERPPRFHMTVAEATNAGIDVDLAIRECEAANVALIRSKWREDMYENIIQLPHSAR